MSNGGQAGGPRRRGVSLIEILIATLVMAAVLLPIATFILGGLRRTEISKHSTIALAIAANIMDFLLSPDVPFGAIDPSGTSGDGGVTGAGLPKSLPTVGNSRAQATFRNVAGAPTAARIESFLNDGKQSDARVKLSEEGLEFEVFLFAGTYEDFEASRVDLEKELTFTYLPNPYVKPDGEAAKQPVLSQPAPVSALFPYTRTPEPKRTPPTRIDDYNPGWPDPPSGTFGDDPAKLREDIGKAYDELRNTSQRPEYFAFFEDQRRFGKPEGGLMKLVVGVRWNPNTNVRKGVGYTKNSKELWLVSFKANLTQK